MKNEICKTRGQFWKDVHKYENSIKKRDVGLYNELLFIDGVLYCH